MKRTLLVSIALGGLLLVGAGCESNQPAPATTTPADTKTTETTPTDTTTGAASTNQPQILNLTATSDNHGQVVMNWTLDGEYTPGDFTVRLLHSAKPNVELPGRAFWQELPNNQASYTWEGVPSGDRYFKVCKFVFGKCTDYSNEVELNVK